MVSLSTLHPACYLPSFLNSYIPNAVACPPPPSVARTIFDTITSPFTSTYTTLKTTGDAILGLPFLSFLLIPTMTSYSTSLNLLFFYLTWSTLVLSHHPLRVEVVGSLMVKILFYVIPSGVFLLVDILFPGVSEGFKSRGADALPLRDTRRKSFMRLIGVLGWSLFNVLLGVALQGLIEWILTVQMSRPAALRVTTTLPLPWGIVKDLLKGLVLRDVLTWLVHRYLLHGGPRPANAILRDLSHLHETWYHKAVKTPYPLSPTYDHPLVYILRVFIPMYTPAILWRFHALVFMLYLALISLEETFTHSGYARLPTNFLLGGIANRNELHCLTKGRGNFGTWGLCDWLADTTIGPDAADDIVDEMEEADVQGKVVKGVNRSVAKVSKAATGRSGGASASPKRRRRTRRTRSDSDYSD
ncbi:hypothetical protein H2198_001686 [Neophaeococcomyces mojaviensis]|uniref:Uncharacterized protein n=1 Tax=Neophaeococcomyces mojaviensis TaxID=3383035 RepID=A0ACC3AGE4_9EURO|nr:hypothetical protein H2198_001686 [Knufia sp. JES_112]